MKPNVREMLVDTSDLSAAMDEIFSSLQANDIPAASMLSERLLLAEPDNFAGLLGRGIALYVEGSVKQATEMLGRVICINKRCTLAHEVISGAFLRLGELVRAEQHARSAMAIDPMAFQSSAFLTEALARQGKHAEAVRHLCQRQYGSGLSTHERELLIQLYYLSGDYSNCMATAGRQSGGPGFPPTPGSPLSSVAAQNVQAAQILQFISSSAATHHHAAFPAAHHGVFVFGVTGRSGTTLIQRLLNSAGEIAVFGEDRVLGIDLPNTLLSTASNLLFLDRLAAGDRLRLQAGEDFWSPRAHPNLAGYFELLLRTFYEAANYVARNAYELRSCKHWGVKVPDPKALRVLLALLPQSRFVFIYRNLFDIARSYKARGWLDSIDDVRRLGAEWAANMASISPLRLANLQLVKYEDMVDAPAAYAARLSGFTGLSGFDLSIYERKINTFGNNPCNAYLAPHDLSDEEIDALRVAGGTMLTDFSYEP